MYGRLSWPSAFPFLVLLSLAGWYGLLLAVR